MNNLHRWPSIDAFYQDSVHLANRFQRRRILKISQWETRITWGGHAWKWIRTKWAIYKENLPYNVDAYYQVYDHLAKRFQRRRLFWNEPIRYKNCLGWPCLLMDPDEMSKHYRGSHIDTFFLRSFGSFGQLASVEKNLKNQPITNKNRLWRPGLLTDRDEMSNLYRGSSTDDSYQVLDDLAKQFQRRRFLEIDQSEIRIAWGDHVC